MSRSPSPLVVTLRKLSRLYLGVRKARALSPRTLEGEEYRLRLFASWLSAEREKLRSLVEIDRSVLDDYAIYLGVYEDADGHRLKASTRHAYLSAVRSFFTWLESRGKLLLNPAEDLALPKVPKRLPRGVLTAEEVTRVLRVPDLETPLGLRNRTLLELLYSTGIRNAELRALKLADLNFAEGLVTVHEGKGTKDRVVPMGEAAASFLRRYLDESRPSLRRSRFEEHVILSRFGKALSKAQLIRLMEATGRKAGLGKPLTCHGLRHSCATHMLQGGADIRHIQEMLGHATLSATEIYTHVAPTDLKRVHARCHPREKKKP